MTKTNTRTVFLTIVLLTCFPAAAQAEEWKGVIPGMSTRSDVVRLFQRCEDRTLSCEFELAGDRIRIVFSGMVQDYFYQCSKKLPLDTVLLVEVTPKVPRRLKSFDENLGLVRLGSKSEFSGYVDKGAGLVLKTYKNKVIQLNYVADLASRRRCEDYYSDLTRFVWVVTHCPPVSLEGPAETISAGNVLNFKASVQPDPKMTLVWTVSGGKILNLAGNQMSVDTSGLGGLTLKVTIQARGSCSVETSSSLQIKPHFP